MRDIFLEQLGKRKSGTKEMAMKAGILIAAVALSVISLIFLGGIFPFALAAICFLVHFSFGMLHVEYEYNFTNGELDIDCIYSKRKRKRVFSGEVKQIEMMCPKEENGYEHLFSTAMEKKDYSFHTDAQTYKFIVQSKGKKTLIYFDPNEEFLKAMKPYLGMQKLIVK